LPPLSHSNIVYKLCCVQCDASYVGQTRKLLKTRIDEHRSQRNTNQSSVITEHRLKFLHDFDWDNVEILDEEIHFNKRIISEILSKKGMLNRLLAYIEVLLPLFRDADCFSSCACFVSDCHCIF